jgi:hypothetical protein
MALALRKNFARGLLSADINASVTQIVLNAGHTLPITAGSFPLVIWDYVTYPDPADDVNLEIVTASYAGVANTFDIVRAQESTLASAHSSGDRVALHFTAKMSTDDLIDHTHPTSSIVSGVFADARISESSVTQHQGAIDHGSITGLSDDDHALYHTDGRADTWLAAGHETNYNHSDIALNTSHRGSSGTDHSYIDQDVASGSSPTFAGLTLSGIADTQVVYSNSNVLAGDSTFTFNNSTKVLGVSKLGVGKSTVVANMEVVGNLGVVTSDADPIIGESENGIIWLNTSVQWFMYQPNASSELRLKRASDLFTFKSDGNLQLNASGGLELGSTSDALKISDTYKQCGFNLNNATASGGQLIIGAWSVQTRDYGHTPPANPTVFVHSVTSPSVASDEWMSFTHNQTNGVFSIGKGSYNWTHAVADTDITHNFIGTTNSGAYAWMEDEDYFKYSDDILMDGSEKTYFRDTAIGIYSQANTFLDLFADGAIRLGDSSAGAPTNYLKVGPTGLLSFVAAAGLTYGFIYNENNTIATTLTSANTWYRSYDSGQAWTSGTSKDMTLGDGYIQVDTAGHYLAIWSASIEFSAVPGAAQNVEGGLMVDPDTGTYAIVSGGTAHRTIANSTDTGNFASFAVLDLDANDRVGLGFNNNTSASKIIHNEHASLILIQIAGT